MADSVQSSTKDPRRNPLIPIGLAILTVLIIPPLIYSIGPQGPIKKDNVVFSTGQHRANFANMNQFEILGYQGFCLLEAREQLLVLESAEAREDGMYLLHKMGSRKKSFPGCPSQAQVLLHEHQITLKPDMWGGIEDMLTRWFLSD
ncbi:hypothetical protein [Candidatus Nitronereus thalassa]|uniref:Uncharacterized protein n=1 Tax=Candidatus Nitronereus thalassa TaxID=3020898 RepID=A0ABU3K3I4_9BACT|nr:hypothetical protein [Candidatus Nitronereus thalassa]MDT7040940.1 hypothetical protein [Candidatus Nitronereus thalassa]